MIAAATADYEVGDDLASLRLNATGGSAVLSAEKLRFACKCAHCTRARFDGRFPASFPGIGIIAVQDLGYGINIAFSDGHNRGIYPRPYLMALLAD